MEVLIHEVKSKGDLKKFIFLPEKVHLHHANWVPPVYADEWKFYDGKYNKSILESDTIFLLALRGE
ncbi:MAG: hypothetical protein NTV09_00520 [Bacteroidetes bacterium]|nr:hypothetical protein [Bacteroidota bacterium]